MKAFLSLCAASVGSLALAHVAPYVHAHPHEAVPPGDLVWLVGMSLALALAWSLLPLLLRRDRSR